VKQNFGRLGEFFQFTITLSPTKHMIKKSGKEYFPTYHPATGMRFPKIRKILERLKV